jgi:hypothetical protein
MRAVITTLRSGGADLTRRALEKCALSASQCEKILAEAREGEFRLAENGDAQTRLRRLLNLDAALMPSTREFDRQEAAIATPRTSKRKPGIRDPKRDPIGERQVAYV